MRENYRAPLTTLNYFITAINTDSGKTLVSSILCEAFRYDYWKPVQAGFPRDADTVKSLITNKETMVYPETYLLKEPASPHAAAAMEGVSIHLNDFNLPTTSRSMVIEGAGGCLVPLNNDHFVIDLAKKFNSIVILVSNLYLGSINHTLLTFEALKARDIPVLGIIFNGPSNPASERIILQHTKLKHLLSIGLEQQINKEVVAKYASCIKMNLAN